MGFLHSILNKIVESKVPESVDLDELSYPLVYMTNAVAGNATYVTPDGVERNVKVSQYGTVIVLVEQKNYNKAQLWEAPKNDIQNTYDSCLEPAYSNRLDDSTVVAKGYLEFLTDNLPVVRFTSPEGKILCIGFGIEKCAMARACENTEINVHMFNGYYMVNINEIGREYTRKTVEADLRFICSGTVQTSSTPYDRIDYTDPDGVTQTLETKDISSDELNKFEGSVVDLYINQKNYSDIRYDNLLKKLKHEVFIIPYSDCEAETGNLVTDFKNSIKGTLECFNGEVYSISFEAGGITKRISVMPCDTELIDDEYVGMTVEVFRTSEGQYVYMSDDFVM